MPALPKDTDLIAERDKMRRTKAPRAAHSAMGTWAGTIVRALDANGIDGTSLAERAGIDPQALHDPEARVAREALTRLWQLAVQATGKESFGLITSSYAVATSFHALGYAALASNTLREAMDRIIRYRRMIGDIVRLSLEEDNQRARFVVDVSSAPGAVPPEAVDALTATLVRQARLLRGDRSFSPIRVSLQRPQPHDLEPYQQTFRTPLLFAQPRNFIELHLADIEQPLPAANAELARQNDAAVVRYLARLEKSGVTPRVQQAILDALPNGAPSKQQVGRTLGMSPRNLQRHLAAEQTSFKELLNDARLRLACNYVEEGRAPLSEIAFVVGFADLSAFSRAFKRWTGLSPSDYARDHRQTAGTARKRQR